MKKISRIILAVLALALSALLFVAAFNTAKTAVIAVLCGIVSLVAAFLLIIGRDAKCIPIVAEGLLVLGGIIAIPQTTLGGILMIVLGILAFFTMFIRSGEEKKQDQ